MIDFNKFRERLIKEEGLELKPYVDSVGKLTIGIGRNLDDRGITEEEAYFLCRNDMAIAYRECKNNFKFFDDLPDDAQLVLADMCFNMGITKLKTFTKTMQLIEKHDFKAASVEMLDSLWARQVGKRAVELSEILKNAK